MISHFQKNQEEAVPGMHMQEDPTDTRAYSQGPIKYTLLSF